MAKQVKTKKPVDKIPQKNPSHETIKQKVKRHMADKKNRITDEDIRHAKIETVVKEEPHEKKLPPSAGGKQASDISKKKRKRKIIPWDIVDDQE